VVALVVLKSHAQKGFKMHMIKTVRGNLVWKLILLLSLGLAAGCATSKVRTDYVEIPNPAFTMAPNAPETIWVPRESVDNGVPRGGELAKRGYEAVKEGLAPSQPVPGTATVTSVSGTAAVTAPQAGIAGLGGKPATFIPRFGLVVGVDGDKVYFNLGKAAGITPFQTLKVFRGGTVVEGLGLAPGELVATVEVQGFVGTSGGYGIIKKGGPLRINDLVGGE
jgi:hypothetical protein